MQKESFYTLKGLVNFLINKLLAIQTPKKCIRYFERKMIVLKIEIISLFNFSESASITTTPSSPNKWLIILLCAIAKLEEDNQDVYGHRIQSELSDILEAYNEYC